MKHLQPVVDSIQEAFGIARSLVIYRGRPLRQRAWAQFYGDFIRPGDLCFDIGAHVGSRLHAWSRLRARVVALEPQPQCMRLLRHWYGSQDGIVLLEQAVGAQVGRQTLWISRRNPTVSTLSRRWQDAVQRSSGFAGVRWDSQISVPVTTLDALVERYGEPAFCKIDVEGGELRVLQGLSRPLRALSFEFIPADMVTAQGCIERLGELGDYQYNWALGERPQLLSLTWLNPRQMQEVLQAMPLDGSSGDVYARRCS